MQGFLGTKTFFGRTLASFDVGAPFPRASLSQIYWQTTLDTQSCVATMLTCLVSRGALFSGDFDSNYARSDGPHGRLHVNMPRVGVQTSYGLASHTRVVG